VRHKESSFQFLLILIPLTQDSCLIQNGEKYPDSVKIGDKSSSFDSLLRFCVHGLEFKATTSQCTWGGGGLVRAQVVTAMAQWRDIVGLPRLTRVMLPLCDG
jgi:hypothetical protein